MLTWDVLILDKEFLKVRIDPPSLMLSLTDTCEFFGGIYEKVSKDSMKAYLAFFSLLSSLAVFGLITND